MSKCRSKVEDFWRSGGMLYVIACILPIITISLIINVYNNSRDRLEIELKDIKIFIILVFSTCATFFSHNLFTCITFEVSIKIYKII